MTVRTRSAGDDGFSLVEAVVSAMVLMLFAAGVAGLIGAGLRVSKSDKQRVAAADLAGRELEIARDAFRASDANALALVDQGPVVNANPLPEGGYVVDGTAYSVRRTAQFAPTGTGASACDGGAAVTYPNVRLAVDVTWPQMGSVAPVHVDSIITPTKKVLDSGYAFVAVKVLTQAAAPSPGRTVRAVGPVSVTGSTDASGCAVLGLSSAGTYTVSLSEAGYVDSAGNPSPTRNVSVTAGSFQALSVTYDRAASARVRLQPAVGGHVLPSPLPYVAVGNTSLATASRTLAVPAASDTVTVAGLPPFSDGYTAFGGGCPDADPTGPPTGGTLTKTVIAPGQQQDLTASLPAVTVTLARAAGSSAPLAGVTVTATHAAGCPSGQDVLQLGTTDSSGVLRASLPYGSWTVRAGTGATTFTPAPSTLAQPVQVTVS